MAKYLQTAIPNPVTVAGCPFATKTTYRSRFSGARRSQQPQVVHWHQPRRPAPKASATPNIRILARPSGSQARVGEFVGAPPGAHAPRVTPGCINALSLRIGRAL